MIRRLAACGWREREAVSGERLPSSSRLKRDYAVTRAAGPSTSLRTGGKREGDKFEV